MQRRWVYGGELPRTEDFEAMQINALVAMSRLFEDLIGNVVDPSAAAMTYPALLAGYTPSYPGDLSLTLSAGRLYKRADVDVVEYGETGTDARQVYQMAQTEIETLEFAAAPGVGLARIDLVQVRRVESDQNDVVLAYYNSANPSQPLSGSGDNGVAQPQDRTQLVEFDIKEGTADASPTAPTADAGWTPVYVVLLTNGDTDIDSSMVTIADNAPFIAGLRKQHHTGATGGAPQIDLTTEVTGVLPAASGGVDVVTALGADPTAIGQFRFVRAAAGATTIYASVQNADDAYAWVIIYAG